MKKKLIKLSLNELKQLKGGDSTTNLNSTAFCECTYNDTNEIINDNQNETCSCVCKAVD